MAKAKGKGANKPSQNGDNQPFWKSILGIITTVTGLIVAITTLVTLLTDNGIIGSKDPPTDTPTAVAVLPSSTPLPSTATDTPLPSATLNPALPSPTITETPLPPTATPTLTPTEANLAFTPTATFYPGEPILVAIAGPGLNIRSGPGYDFPYGPAISTLSYGTTVRILGRNAAGDWYQIECPSNVASETGCWVFGDPELVNAFVIVQLTVVPAPPTITPLPTDTPLPSPTSTPLG